MPPSPQKISDAAAVVELDALVALAAIRAIGLRTSKTEFQKLVDENWKMASERINEIAT